MTTLLDTLVSDGPVIHLREGHRSRRRAKGKGKDVFKRVDNSDARWFRGTRKRQTHWQWKIRNEYHANLTSVEDFDCYSVEDVDESANAYQAHNDPG